VNKIYIVISIDYYILEDIRPLQNIDKINTLVF